MKVKGINPEHLKKLLAMAEQIRSPIKIRVISLSALALIALGISYHFSEAFTALSGEYAWRFNKKEEISDLAIVNSPQERLQKYLPSGQADLNWWLGRLRAMSREMGVTLRTLTCGLADANSVAGYPVVEISYEFQGTYNLCLGVLAWLESSIPVIKVDQVALTPLGLPVGHVVVSTRLKVLFVLEADR